MTETPDEPTPCSYGIHCMCIEPECECPCDQHGGDEK